MSLSEQVAQVTAKLNTALANFDKLIAKLAKDRDAMVVINEYCHHVEVTAVRDYLRWENIGELDNYLNSIRECLCDHKKLVNKMIRDPDDDLPDEYLDVGVNLYPSEEKDLISTAKAIVEIASEGDVSSGLCLKDQARDLIRILKLDCKVKESDDEAC